MPARNTAEVIRASPMFAGLSYPDLTALAAAAREERISARRYVFTEGDDARWFCLVASGRVKIFRESRDGREVVLELLGPGEPFGGVYAPLAGRAPVPARAELSRPGLERCAHIVLGTGMAALAVAVGAGDVGWIRAAGVVVAAGALAFGLAIGTALRRLGHTPVTKPAGARAA
jgi:hypothetical protein